MKGRRLRDRNQKTTPALQTALKKRVAVALRLRFPQTGAEWGEARAPRKVQREAWFTKTPTQHPLGVSRSFPHGANERTTRFVNKNNSHVFTY